MLKISLPMLIIVLAVLRAPARSQTVIENVTVYREAGRFGGWPANHGIWSWGNEIVVGFGWGYFKLNEHDGHAIDNTRPGGSYLARSRDGGKTWVLEPSLFERAKGKPVTAPPGGIDFSHRDFAMMVRMSGMHVGVSSFFYSTDRWRTVRGPYKLPLFDQPGILARTDYIVNGRSDCMVFTAASKSNQREGRVICVRTMDGGKNWKLLSYIGSEPDGFSIMPSSVRLSPTRILTAIRRNEGDLNWIDAYISNDNGASWQFLNKPAPSTGGHAGNPPSMVKLKDGRLAITYGYRSQPYGIRARISTDQGLTWGPEIVVRKDGGCWDLGYPRTVQRPDGKLVTIYYFNDSPDTERYIAATIWDAGSPKH
jgi:hypothetical protein